MTTTEEMVFYSPLRKISGKRCLSPLKANKDDSKRNTRRKTNNPVLILAQNHSRKNGGTLLQEQTIFEPPRRFSDDYQGGDLSGYSNLEELDTVFKSDMELTLGGRQDSDGVIGVKPDPIVASPCVDGEGSTDEMTFSANFFQTENDVSTDILGSLNSLETASIPWPSTSQGTISRRSSGTMFSTSYTSWTKPEAGGHRTSENSFVPHSSILDKETCSAKPIPRSRSVRRTSKRSSCGRYLKRDSSADTSKDIDDIEDFEFDGGLDELVHDDESTYQTHHDEMMRPSLHPSAFQHPFPSPALASPDQMSSGTPNHPMSSQVVTRQNTPVIAITTSPDLAYESLDPSADELSK